VKRALSFVARAVFSVALIWGVRALALAFYLSDNLWNKPMSQLSFDDLANLASGLVGASLLGTVALGILWVVWGTFCHDPSVTEDRI
jgi:hypothetical protein